ncbi:single-stranded DNA-binding protein [Streptomyces wedmorensis]|uniref:single-stranded DNA-binding protein n=1 Tax=Streptomyces wedmorensis TaxID=43759 RepID=UPI0034267CF3
MNDTTVTLVGNVATAVEYRDTAAGGVARFRFAVTARRWDREQGAWSDGPTSFYTVSAWRSLGANLAASVSVGEPLVVHGRLKVREDERDGQRKTFVDVAAVAVGHDLSRGTAAFRRAARAEPELRADGGPQPPPRPQAGAAPKLSPRPPSEAEEDPWTVASDEATKRLVTAS